MKKINLKDYYPFYDEDYYIEVSDRLEAFLRAYEQKEKAYQEKTRYHKAYYSIERDEGVGNSMRYVSLSPEEIYERKLTRQELYSLLNMLSEVQAKRIYAYYFLGMSRVEIAKADATDTATVKRTIERGLKRMGRYLKQSSSSLHIAP